MKRTRYFLAGVLVGAVLFGGSVAYAAGVIAERSINTIYIDGKQVELEAYSINGSNYLKLRDVGKTVGFNVYWDGAVQIDTASPYTGEAPSAPASEIRVNCSHGNTIPAGERRALIISPSGTNYTVSSSDPTVRGCDRDCSRSGSLCDSGPEATIISSPIQRINNPPIIFISFYYITQLFRHYTMTREEFLYFRYYQIF